MGLKSGSHKGVRYMWFFQLDVIWLRRLILFAIPFFLDPISRDAKVMSELVYAVGLGVPIFAHADKYSSGA